MDPRRCTAVVVRYARPVNPASDLLSTLRLLQRRMMVRQFLRSMVRAALVFYGVLTVLTATAWALDAFRPQLSGLAYALSWPLVASVLAGALLALLRRPALRAVAAEVDELGATRNRLLTAFDFTARERPSDLQMLAIREATAFARGRDFQPLLPFTIPRELRWLLLPALALAALWWTGLRENSAREQRIAAAQQETGATVKHLETLAEQWKRRGANDEAARRLAERLKQSAVQVRAEAEQGKDAAKAALRELALLEQLVQEFRRPDAPTSDELKALAKALGQDERIKDAARAMEQGKLAEAAQKLAEAAKDEPTAERAQQSLQQALNHLAERKEQMSKQLEQMRAQGEGGGERQQLLQQLSEMLNEMQQNGQMAQQPGQQKGKKPGEGSKSNQPMSDQDLKNLLSALQRMKEGQQGGGGEPQGEPGEGEGQPGTISMQGFSNTEKNGDPGTPDPHLPSGKAGSEKDEGTTENPFGHNGTAAESQRSAQMSGKLAEGESLSALVPSAAKGDAKATRRYRELTDAAAAAAAEAVNQEEIPLGARFLIRRYFEAIRP